MTDDQLLRVFDFLTKLRTHTPFFEDELNDVWDIVYSAIPVRVLVERDYQREHGEHAPA